MTIERTDVVVVGAGPVGLLTAIESTLGGAHVVVLERLTSVSTISKALGIGPLGCEALQRRGMAAAIDDVEAISFAALRKSAEQSGVEQRTKKYSGHFAGLSLIRKDVQTAPERRMRMVDQHAVEAMLFARARSLGIDVRRACDVTGLSQRSDGVEVEYVSAIGPSRIRCAYLVGCDGGRSSVRRMAGLAFPGTPATATMYTAIVDVDHPQRLQPFGWNHTPEGVFSYGALPGRLFMIDFSGPPADRLAAVTTAEIETVLRRISGRDVRVEALRSASRWTDNTRLVDDYRRDRVLLAGDAAHIHSPFGGQGMSLGLVDAQNLGWKLASVVRGDLPAALLDTYTTERRPVAEAVLANTLAQTALMRPDPQSAAMRNFMATLMEFDDVNQLVGATMSGLAQRYDLGSAQDAVGRLISDRMLGRCDGGLVPLYDLMDDGRGVLLDASHGAKASRLAEADQHRVRCVRVLTGPSMLIRPDACVAWIGQDHETSGLEPALRRWFGHARDTRSHMPVAA